MTRAKPASKPAARAGATAAKAKPTPDAPVTAAKEAQVKAVAAKPVSAKSSAKADSVKAAALGKPTPAKESPRAAPAKSSLAKRSSFPPPEKTRVVAVCNQKGGCGKTTTVINVAAGLASLGQRVLVIDLDSQCNATTGLGINVEELELSTFDLLMEPKPEIVEEVILESAFENLHVAPGSIELSEFESRAASEIGRENKLKKAIALLQGLYDFILIDTPPSLGLLSVNALNAATEVHIALQSHPFAFDGLNLLMETICLVQEELNPKLQVTGVVVTMYDNRTKISREIVERAQAMDVLDGKLFGTVVRQNIKLTEASKLRKPVMYYDPLCSGSVDYLDLCREICTQHAADAKAAPVLSRTNAGKDSTQS